jgi:hypothetical protein
MMTEYKFNVTLQPYTPKEGQTLAELGVVRVDTDAQYGYWEYRDGTEGGGLWFAKCDGATALELVDYDGAFELPRAVVRALRAAGYVLDETFDA